MCLFCLPLGSDPRPSMLEGSGSEGSPHQSLLSLLEGNSSHQHEGASPHSPAAVSISLHDQMRPPLKAGSLHNQMRPAS